MALLIDASDPLGSANASTIDNNLRTLKTAIEDIFGVPDNTTIGVAGFAFNSSGLRRVRFQDAAGDPGTAGFLQRNGNDLKYHNGSARTLYMQGGTDVAVADGGTGLSSGTSGGILAFTASTTLASSAALTANGLVYGGGAGVAPGSISALTNGQLPIGRSGNTPTGAQITASTNATVTSASGSITVAAADRAILCCWGQVVEGVGATTGYLGPGGSLASDNAARTLVGVTGTLTAMYVRAVNLSSASDISVTATPLIGGSDVTTLAAVLTPTGTTETSAIKTGGSTSVVPTDSLSVRAAVTNLSGGTVTVAIRCTLLFTATA